MRENFLIFYLIYALFLTAPTFLNAQSSSPLVDHSKNVREQLESTHKKDSIVYVTQLSKLVHQEGLQTIREQLLNSIKIEEENAQLTEISPLVAGLLPLQMENVKKIIRKIEHLKTFWRTQKESIIPYFFSISPSKWMSNQDKKVLSTLNVRELDFYYDIYTTYLGELFLRYSEFVNGELGEFDFQWTQDTLILLARAIEPLRADELGSVKPLAHRAAQLTLEMDTFVENDLAKLLKGKDPHYWERNWLTLVVGTMTAVGGVYALIKFRKEIRHGLAKFGESVGEQIKISIDALKAILGIDRRAVPEPKNIFGQGVNYIHEGLRDIKAIISDDDLRFQIEDIESQLRTLKDKDPREMNAEELNLTERKLKELRRIREKLGHIENAHIDIERGIEQLRSLNPTDLDAEKVIIEEYFDKLLSDRSWVMVGKSIHELIIDERLKHLPEGISREVIAEQIKIERQGLNLKLAIEAVNLKQGPKGAYDTPGDMKFLLRLTAYSANTLANGGKELTAVMRGATNRVLEGIDQVVDRMNRNLELIIAQNRWTIAMSALVPITVVGIGTQYFYSKVRSWLQDSKKEEMRNRTSSMTEMLFAATDKNMNPSLKGKLVYQVDQMKRLASQVDSSMRLDYHDMLEKMLFVDDPVALRDMIFYLSWNFNEKLR